MTDVDRSRAQELIDRARAMGFFDHSPAKVALLEEAVRLADADGTDDDLRWDARHELVHTATFCGFYETALVAFAWQLGKCDENPERWHERDLLWQYKWIISSLHRFPGIPLERIDETTEDMARRYERCGLNQRPVHDVRRRNALFTGNLEATHEHYRLWKATPRDSGADCAACELANEFDYFLVAREQPEEAIELAEPLLDGRMSCAVVPLSCLAQVLVPLLRLGRVEETVAHHLRGIGLIDDRSRAIGSVGDHLDYLAITGNHRRGIALLERRFAWASEGRNLSGRFTFYLGAWVLLSRIAERARKPTRKLRLPRSLPFWREDATYRLDELLAWLEGELRGLADAFDRRNGNEWFARRVTAARELLALDTPISLAGR